MSESTADQPAAPGQSDATAAARAAASAPSPAGTAHEAIRVVGAREHNLRGIDLVIPKRRLTVFTGVSGSGKSSLVFGTIAAESQRLINETYSAFVQGFMPSTARPDVDHLEGLTPAIVVDQERMGGGPRSTVGTVTDASAFLRVLFSQLATPHVGGPGAFSFNVPSVSGAGAMTVKKGGRQVAQKRTFTRVGGMCPRCEGSGEVADIDLDEVLDWSASLEEGPFRVPGYTADGWYARLYRATGWFDNTTPIREYSQRELQDLLHHPPEKVRIGGANMTVEGLLVKLQSSMFSKDRDTLQPHIRAFVERAVTFITCPDCDGTRLAEHARTARISGISIADVQMMPIIDALAWARSLAGGAAVGARSAPLLESLIALLEGMVNIGLGYLTLNRPAGSLSGGEAQRVKMVRHLGSALTDVTYVFDEPSVGLHPHDLARMNRLLLSLRDKGNTVLVVEHKPETIEIADHVVDLGPGAGRDGGQVQYEGDVAGLRASDTLTGQHLDRRPRLKGTVRKAAGGLQVRGAQRNNLQALDVDIPRGVLTVLTGVAGSGKSSLVAESLRQWRRAGEAVTAVDQSAISGSRRSNPATYTGLLDPIRKAFAKANGVKPALFSANSEGACPACGGNGVIFTELGFMETVSTPCEECGGRRFQAEVLHHLLGGESSGYRSIADVLEMSVDEAAVFFVHPEVKVPAAVRILTHLQTVGLGYLTIGQGLNTLSGGERQRLKLAMRMGESGDVLVLDEPTTGLHLADVAFLLDLLDRLVDDGRTVVVVEHHLSVIAHADHVIDLGPGAGADGGRVVFAGSPQRLVASAHAEPAGEGNSLTGRYLAQRLRA